MGACIYIREFPKCPRLNTGLAGFDYTVVKGLYWISTDQNVSRFRPEDVNSEVVEELKRNEGFVVNKRRGTAHLFRCSVVTCRFRFC